MFRTFVLVRNTICQSESCDEFIFKENICLFQIKQFVDAKIKTLMDSFGISIELTI